MADTCTIGQPFGTRYNPSYAKAGLDGHTAIDASCGDASPIYSKYDGIVTLVWTFPSAAADGYTCVSIIVDNGIESFEWQVGHLDPCVTEGQAVHAGDLIGYEANHGTVYSGNILITQAMQKAGDRRGHHRHYQKRPAMPVRKTSSYMLMNSKGGQYRDAGGFYYQIFDYNNGYNGCVDPMQPTFWRDLWLGRSGYDVFVLQRILSRKGFLTAEPTGFFGPLTSLALAKYQSSLGLPATSYFGRMTRAWALRETLPLPALSTQ